MYSFHWHHQRNSWILPIKSLRISRDKHVSDSSDYLIMLVGCRTLLFLPVSLSLSLTLPLVFFHFFFFRFLFLTYSSSPAMVIVLSPLSQLVQKKSLQVVLQVWKMCSKELREAQKRVNTLWKVTGAKLRHDPPKTTKLRSWFWSLGLVLFSHLCSCGLFPLSRSCLLVFPSSP